MVRKRIPKKKRIHKLLFFKEQFLRDFPETEESERLGLEWMTGSEAAPSY